MYSFELEKKVLAGLLQHQSKWAEISSFLIDDDFYSEDSKVHISLFKLLRNALNNAEAIDDTILIDRIKNLNVSFPDDIDIQEYIRALQFHKIEEKVFENSVRELKKYTLRRKGLEISNKIKSFVTSVDPSESYSSITEGLDKIYNDTVRKFECGESRVVNLGPMAEQVIEYLGENPPTNTGIMSPYPTVNRIYGSLVKPGNCAIIAARAKCGKTTMLVDMATKMAYKEQVPILHFDNGEMSARELIMRMVSSMSGVPMYLLESGKWRKSSYKDWSAKDVVERVRSVWDKTRNIKILYENVAGMDVEEMKSLMKRIYYSEVGRGKPMIFSFDYLKTDFNNLGKGADWAFAGRTLHLFKQCIARELVFDGEPTVGMLTSVQTNRQGIVSSKKGLDAIIEDESVVANADQYIQFASHLFLLRKKVIEEIVDEGEEFGTHKLICLAARHLGEDAFSHINPIKMADGSLRDNFINLKFESFNVEDCGDLAEIERAKAGDDVIPVVGSDEDDELPLGF